MNMEHDSLGYLTNRAARLFVRALDRRLKAMGLSVGYMPVIVALGNGAEMTQQALTEFAGLEQPTMAATLARMERDGLVQRRPNPSDKRSAFVRLSPSATEKTRAVWAASAALNEAAFEGVSEPDRVRHMDAMAEIIARLVALEEKETR